MSADRYLNVFPYVLVHILYRKEGMKMYPSDSIVDQVKCTADKENLGRSTIEEKFTSIPTSTE